MRDALLADISRACARAIELDAVATDVLPLISRALQLSTIGVTAIGAPPR